MFIDITVFQFLREFAGKSGFFDAIILAFARYLPYLLTAGAIWFLAVLKPRRKQIFAFLFSALTVLVSRGFFTELVRYFYDRGRPFEALEFKPLFSDINPAFPSGHAAFFFALAFALMYFNRKAGYWFIFFALLNGLARIAAGVHWPSDILGGIAVAFVSVFIVKKLLGIYSVSAGEIKNPDHENQDQGLDTPKIA